MRRVLAAAVLVVVAAWGQHRPARSRSSHAAVTFNNQVVRIFQNRCQTCHRPGDVAPFPLVTYQDARVQARRIKTEVQARRMPPWKPVPGHGEFLDENRLTEQEIDLITRWVDAGAPEGDPEDLPPPVVYSDQWALGTPDLILEPEADFPVPAEGRDIYRCFSVPTRLLESRGVSGFDIRPGNRRVVHHVIVFTDPLGLSALKRGGDSPGYGCFGGPGIPADGAIGGWAPGIRPRMFPEGVGVRLTPFGRVVIQVHYHTSGVPETDRTRVGIYFARERLQEEIFYLPLLNWRFVIPPGAARHEVRASMVMPYIRGVEALFIAPHMHLLGREIRVDATYPDGTRRPMIYIDDWDFDWQAVYYYRQPVPLPPGTRLELVAVYDNSENNPRNPFQPPRAVRWGEESTDEMCLAIIGVIRR
jgi:hypothetical protein